MAVNESVVTGRGANQANAQKIFEYMPDVTGIEFSLKVQVLECEVCLHNACGLDSGPQDILLSRDVGGLGYPVQVVQVAAQ